MKSVAGHWKNKTKEDTVHDPRSKTSQRHGREMWKLEPEATPPPPLKNQQEKQTTIAFIVGPNSNVSNWKWIGFSVHHDFHSRGTVWSSVVRNKLWKLKKKAKKRNDSRSKSVLWTVLNFPLSSSWHFLRQNKHEPVSVFSWLPMEEPLRNPNRYRSILRRWICFFYFSFFVFVFFFNRDLCRANETNGLFAFHLGARSFFFCLFFVAAPPCDGQTKRSTLAALFKKKNFTRFLRFIVVVVVVVVVVARNIVGPCLSCVDLEVFFLHYGRQSDAGGAFRLRAQRRRFRPRDAGRLAGRADVPRPPAAPAPPFPRPPRPAPERPEAAQLRLAAPPRRRHRRPVRRRRRQELRPAVQRVLQDPVKLSETGP